MSPTSRRKSIRNPYEVTGRGENRAMDQTRPQMGKEAMTTRRKIHESWPLPSRGIQAHLFGHRSTSSIVFSLPRDLNVQVWHAPINNEERFDRRNRNASAVWPVKKVGENRQKSFSRKTSRICCCNADSACLENVSLGRVRVSVRRWS